MRLGQPEEISHVSVLRKPHDRLIIYELSSQNGLLADDQLCLLLVLPLRLLNHGLIHLNLGLRIDDQVELHGLSPRQSSRVLPLLLGKQLTRRLSIVVDLFLEALSLHGVADSVQVEAVLIGDAGERVEALLGLSLSLLAPEDVVDPAVEVLRHILRLKGLPHVYHEQVGVILTPGRQFHVVDHLTVLLFPEVDLVVVDEELRTVEELGDQLSHVCMVVQCRVD